MKDLINLWIVMKITTTFVVTFVVVAYFLLLAIEATTATHFFNGLVPELVERNLYIEETIQGLAQKS